MAKMFSMLLTALLLAAPSLALAHPGHGSGDSGAPAHYLTEPMHVLAGAAVVAVVAAVILGLRHGRRVRGRSINK